MWNEILTVADDKFVEFHDLKGANVVEMDDPLLYKEDFQLFFPVTVSRDFRTLAPPTQSFINACLADATGAK